MINPKKYVVYYREVPAALSSFISNDKNCHYTKDGIKTGLGHSCPRLTIIMQPTKNQDADRMRCKKLEELLQLLESNNQIVGFS